RASGQQASDRFPIVGGVNSFILFPSEVKCATLFCQPHGAPRRSIIFLQTYFDFLALSCQFYESLKLAAREQRPVVDKLRVDNGHQYFPPSPTLVFIGSSVY